MRIDVEDRERLYGVISKSSLSIFTAVRNSDVL